MSMANFDPVKAIRARERRRPPRHTTVLGAVAGACALGFLTAMLAASFFPQRGGEFIPLGLAAGGMAGYRYPQAGHWAGYVFVLFVNLMLSLWIAMDPVARLAVFAGFCAVELLFAVTFWLLSRE